MGISFAVLRQLCVVMVSTAHYQLWAVLEQFLVALVSSGEAPEYFWENMGISGLFLGSSGLLRVARVSSDV